MDMKRIDEDLWEFGQIESPNGNDRLSLRFEAVGSDAYDFHSLVWERHNQDNWLPYVSIGATEFGPPHPCRKWITDLHTFDPDSGVAIIRVGEEENTTGFGEPTIRARYSWRSWNLRTNQECQFLQSCADPFEPYRAQG